MNLKNIKNTEDLQCLVANYLVTDQEHYRDIMYSLFYLKNEELPLYFQSYCEDHLDPDRKISKEIINEIISTDYNYDIQYIISNTDTCIYIVSDFIVVRLNKNYYIETDIKNIIAYDNNIEYNIAIAHTFDKIKNNKIKNLIKNNFLISKGPSKSHINSVGILSSTGDRLGVKYSEITEPPQLNNLENLYNDDFKDVNNNIITSLKNNNTGIILLHGEPGTGKTSYIRQLIRTDLGKKFIYMAPFIIQQLGSPDLISFLTEFKNKIFIVEDAENALKTREAGGNEGVANLLNMSDGIMGDIIQSQFIFTFNCRVDEIDPALKRPGRLLEQYEFTRLNEEKTAKLWAETNPDCIQPKKEMTLAEIFNHNTAINSEEKIISKDKGFGFMKKAV